MQLNMCHRAGAHKDTDCSTSNARVSHTSTPHTTACQWFCVSVCFCAHPGIGTHTHAWYKRSGFDQPNDMSTEWGFRTWALSH
jgi:hypothetical protein